jgi:hypothetical protein
MRKEDKFKEYCCVPLPRGLRQQIIEQAEDVEISFDQAIQIALEATFLRKIRPLKVLHIERGSLDKIRLKAIVDEEIRKLEEQSYKP